ncbi:uncharacterized protein LOC115874109 [Sitophilus oryzae]|uniref:Uncharacterized protein LOC115874109 n=1 Tax=Sitophilus oryzae TaxID=7048 RepID=A0A6J2X2A4_SITOR|nr:uncharacterized protein LOC115874109 [Sitophilus oryzae]XP_030745059.1 uncharacterized protein LOC115874109 [Sitophilus oryzae]XP_030745060.1 uncharacterized protein LOC115874109 [Sitophilus oryzae]
MELKTIAFFIWPSILLCILDEVLPILIPQQPHNFPALEHLHHTNENAVTKAIFTQKGYIQFLKYVVDVPDITDYTFCIWLKSVNFTYSHPILSYSKHEEKRLIRVWVSPHGTHINLEILEEPVFSIPVNFIEHEWYHICQSWSSNKASWSLYLNGNIAANGYTPQLRNIIIEHGGDIVVGQEYTDFDKGLDDGIEGFVSGFNFVLASTVDNYQPTTHFQQLPPPKFIYKRQIPQQNQDVEDSTEDLKMISVLPKKKRQIWDDGLQFYYEHQLREPLPLDKGERPSYHTPTERPLVYPSLYYYTPKPLGLVLVELSSDCAYLRGAPLRGDKVLINWTKTVVRVFGGAIIKNAPSFCAK